MTESTEQAAATLARPKSAGHPMLRRAARLAAWSIAGLLLIWLLAWAGMPPLLKWLVEREASAALGRSVSVQQVDFRPWTLELELHGLRVAGARDQGEQFTLQRLYLDLELRSLFKLAPVLDAIELDQPQLKLRHLGDGRYDFDDIVQHLLKPDQPPAPLPRFALFNLRLQGGAVDFTDDRVGRTQQIRELRLNLPFLSSLEQQREQASEPALNFKLNGDPVDAKALLRPFAQARQGKGRLHGDGIDLTPYLPYWPAGLPVRPTRGKIDFDLNLRQPTDQLLPLELEGRLALRDAGVELPRDGKTEALQLGWDSLVFEGSASVGGPAPEVTGKSLQLDGLALREGELTPSRLGRLLAQEWQLSLAGRQLRIASLQLEQPELQLQRRARGLWNVENWLPATADRQPASRSGSEKSAPAPAWQLELASVRLSDGRLSLLDQSPARPVKLQLGPIALSSGPLSFTPGKTVQLPLELGFTLARDASSAGGTFHYQGDLTLPGHEPAGQAVPLAAQGRLELDDLPLHLLEPYFAPALNLDLLRAELGLRAQVALSLPPAGPSLQLRGDGEVVRLRASTLDPAERLLDWKSLGLRGLQLDLERGALSRLKVTETVLSDYYARIVIDPLGRINLQQLLRQPGAPAGQMAQNAVPQTTPATGPAAQPRLEFGPIAFVRGQVDFQDHFIKPNYSAHLSELTGRLGGFSNRPAKAGSAPELASLNLRGKAEGSAKLEIDGQLNPLAQPLALDIRGKVDDLELPPLSPYSVKYAGHGIEQGKLGMSVRYQVAPDGQLQASNQILLKQLQFGERVEGSEAPNLPVRLAVSLLADSNGVIDLNLPISGSINDPQFRIGTIVWRMVLGLIGKAVTAPFALIAQAFGGAADDFNQIDFAPGSALLDSAMLKRLDQVAQAMGKRADLRLTLEGQSDLERERGAYQQAQLRHRLLEEKRRQLARAGKPADQVDAPSAAESVALLKEVYRRADIIKPRNLIGLARELPPAEMEKLLLASIGVDSDRMRELALARAAAARDELLRLGVSNERIYLLAPSAPAAEQRDQWRPNVILGLRKD
jgi:Domain of Unknown Function (DUF748)